MKLTLCQATNYAAVKTFYDNLIDEMQHSEYHPKWQKGVYPAYDYLRGAVEQGQLYLACCAETGAIAGAMILNGESNEGYAGVTWPTPAAPEEVSLIHTLGVRPQYSRSGVGRFLVQQAAQLARQSGKKVIRLDVLKGNLPAEKLYLRAGFAPVCEVTLYYEDTGWCAFALYELPL